jgi:uncharacterized protein YkwD
MLARTIARSVARIAALLLGICCASAPTFADDAGTADSFMLLALLNEAREAAGQPPLMMQPALHAFASAWAAELSTQQRLVHRPETIQATWIEANVTPRWRHIGENIAFAPSVAAAHDTLMASDFHRANALGDFTHVGIGAARDTAGHLWVTYSFVAAPDLKAHDLPPSWVAEVSSAPRRPADGADRAIVTVARTDSPAP